MNTPMTADRTQFLVWPKNSLEAEAEASAPFIGELVLYSGSDGLGGPPHDGSHGKHADDHGQQSKAVHEGDGAESKTGDAVHRSDTHKSGGHTQQAGQDCFYNISSTDTDNQDQSEGHQREELKVAQLYRVVGDDRSGKDQNH